MWRQIPFILCQKITVWQPTDWVLQDGSPFIKLSFRQQVQEFFQELFSDLRRAFGEALAVAMVIGQTTALPKGLFSTTKSLTTEIAAQMGNATEGGEMKTALWTMALLLFLLSLLFILLIHYFSRPKKDKE